MILTCFRHDKERNVSLTVEQHLINTLREAGYTVEETDMMSEGTNYSKIIGRKLCIIK